MAFAIDRWIPNHWKADQWSSIKKARLGKSIQERDEVGSQHSVSSKRSSERVKLSPNLFLSSLNASPFHVIVLYEDSFGPLSEAAIQHVEDTFRSIIRMTVLQNGVCMRYHSGQPNEFGWFLLKCVDEITAKWTLEQTISAYNGKDFRIIRVSDLPKNVCISIKIPTQYTDPAKILRVLENQNDGLCTKEWKIVTQSARKGKGGRTFAVISAVIPPKVIPFLHQVEWKPYFEFSRAVVVSHVPAPGQSGKLNKERTPSNKENTEKIRSSCCISLISDDEEEKESESPPNKNVTKTNPVTGSNSSSYHRPFSKVNVKSEDCGKNIKKEWDVMKVEVDRNKIMDYISLVSDDEENASEECPLMADAGDVQAVFDPSLPSTSSAWSDPWAGKDNEWTECTSELAVVEVCTLDESSEALFGGKMWQH